MTAKEVLMQVAGSLPEDASALDAIHQVELRFAELGEAKRVMPVERGNDAPAWLYDSPSRMATIVQQTQKRHGVHRVVGWELSGMGTEF